MYFQKIHTAGYQLDIHNFAEDLYKKQHISPVSVNSPYQISSYIVHELYFPLQISKQVQ